MKNIMLSLAVFASIACFAVSAQAHRVWILPAATTLSGDDPWVTFDAAVSNDIFHPDHHPLGLERVKATGPKGENIELLNPHKGKYRSNFDLNLKEQGTYKVFSASQGITASWEAEDGNRKHWPGRGELPNMAEFDKNVPKDAKNLKVAQSSRRVETFVTAGSPSKKALQPTKVGLEMEPITHPNDLYAGELASFRFLIDGAPAAGAEVTVIPSGMRYRSNQEEIKFTTDKKGMVNITWPKAGMYFLEAEYSDKKAKAPATVRKGTYIATFEVLPQ